MSSWFPIGRDKSDGWHLDIVALLAVTGESFIGEHAQALTSSKLCLLPRIMPAPHALLQPRRPATLPRETAKVSGVYTGIVLDTVGFFANLIHPINELRPFEFRVLKIRHARCLSSPGPSTLLATGGASKKSEDGDATATGVTTADPETGGAPPQGLRRRPTMLQRVAKFASNAPKVHVHGDASLHVRAAAEQGERDATVRALFYSPLHLLTVLSFLVTIGLLTAGALWEDGAALTAVSLASITTATISYAARWEVRMYGSAEDSLLAGDVVVRTRVGAFVVIRCTEGVARELYSGLDECFYVVTGARYRLLMALGAALLMPSVILLGNCSFSMQALVGGAYLVLNVAYWMIGLLPLHRSWDLSRYEVEDITPQDAMHADQPDAAGPSVDDLPSYTRTLWFAIRETKKIAWVERSAAMPVTTLWQAWGMEALEEARKGNRQWKAVQRKNEIMSECYMY